ncbi:MAG: hypothetical protein MUF00_10160 [Gemmatimonadaceae bacterium]|jgi:uncharacterized protein YoxC|nr:hypothetical protein [Gemmatimonadaceae bacterium]
MLGLLALQRAAPVDTIVALTMPAQRTVFDVASGTLQLIVLVLGVAALGALVALLLGLRTTLTRLEAQLNSLRTDATPLLTRLNDVAADARVVTARLRTDVVRVSDAANRMGDTLDRAATRTARRLAAVDRTLAVAQGEVEESILVASSLMRGLRVGAMEWLGGSRNGGPRPSRARNGEEPATTRHRRRFARRRREAPRLRPRDEDA